MSNLSNQTPGSRMSIINSSISDSVNMQGSQIGFADPDNIRIPIIGYEVMEERARFTVSPSNIPKSFQSTHLILVSGFQITNRKSIHQRLLARPASLHRLPAVEHQIEIHLSKYQSDTSTQETVWRQFQQRFLEQSPSRLANVHQCGYGQ